MYNRGGRGALVSAIMMLSIAACQRSTTVGALNNCDLPVEVRAASRSSSVAEVRWKTINAGKRSHVVGVVEGRQALYVDVRSGTDGQIEQFEVPMDQLANPPKDADYEAELVLEGDRCPSP